MERLNVRGAIVVGEEICAGSNGREDVKGIREGFGDEKFSKRKLFLYLGNFVF